MKAIDRTVTQPPMDGGVSMMVSDLLRQAETVFIDDRQAAIACIARASLLLGTYHDMPARPEPQRGLPTPHVVRGGLARWQIDRTLRHIDQGLEGTITLAQLAEGVRLSPGYFSRAFKQSFGVPPHAYVMACRVERAKTMLATTCVPLCDIALECGLADQAHLSRLFRRLTGETPCRWRRRHKMGVQVM